MVFENLWPLIFLIGAPVIIILYLLRPKGTKTVVPSNLIWRKIVGVNQSAAFWEKFVSDPLMYLEILIMLLLTAALMSPLLGMASGSGGSVAIVLDTGASMQHLTEKGNSRFDEAKELALAYLENCRGEVTLITSDSSTHLLASGSTDHGKLKRLIKQSRVTDLAGDLYGVRELLLSEQADRVLILTDGEGAAALEAEESWQVIPLGEAAENLAVVSASASGSDAIVLVKSFADSEAECDVSLYEGENRLLGVRHLKLDPAGAESVLFEDLQRGEEGSYLRAELSAITFSSGREDSLQKDNLNYIFPETGEIIGAVLIGNGNRFIEKAYEAVTGKTITKLENETLIVNERIAIFDAGAGPDDFMPIAAAGKQTVQDEERPEETINGILRFGGGWGETESVKGVIVTFLDSELTEGIEESTFGVNESVIFDVPEWGRSFLAAGEQCLGYYGVDPDGVRRICVGFDIRESDLALLPEFPVWFANSLGFLSDRQILASHIYTAGQMPVINPSSHYDSSGLEVRTDKTGLYSISDGELTEDYAVLFPMEDESDGRLKMEAQNGAGTAHVLVRRSIRRWLILAAILLLVLDLYLYVRRSRYRGRAAYVVRALLLLLLAAALFDLRIPNKKSGKATVFLADLSDSNSENREKIAAYLEDQISQKPASDYYGLVTFGKNALIDQFLTKNKSFAGIMTEPEPAATDIESAIGRAVSMIPDSGAGRVVLITDGRQSVGNIENVKMLLEESGIELCTLFTDSMPGDDAYISRAVMPSRLHLGDAFRLNVSVESNFETDATVCLYSGSRLIEEKSVHLRSGGNSFAFAMQVTGEENENFRVRLKAEGDTCPENDNYYLYADVEEAERLLVISGMNTDSGQLMNVLRAANTDVDTISAANAPDTLSEMLKYKAILLDNVYLGDLPEGFADQIKSYVRDYGGGLIATGGEDSFALGGYRETALEEVLPVDMEPRGVDEIPSMAMVMVIDCSGSMTMSEENGPTRLDLAVEAACRAVENLSSKDYVGIVTFDDTATWQVPIVKAQDKDAIKKSIRTTREGGGTMIYPALNAAFSEIGKTDASVKHILLLTDGEGETRDFGQITDAMKKQGITLSCVAVGEDSDQELLETMAEATGGNYYYSDNRTDIPRIFAREVLMNGEAYLQNGDFSLAQGSFDEITEQLFDDGLPHISGYVASSAKSGARRVIESDKADPVLTVWQYGLGRTVAWNTDTTGVWSGGFIGKDDYVELWRRICDYAFGMEMTESDRVETVTDEAGRTQIRYLTDDYSGDVRVEGIITSPDGTEKEIELTQKTPGVFEEELSENREGIYFLSLKKTKNREMVTGVFTAAVLQFSGEYRFDVTDTAVRRFARENGRVLETGESVWTRLSGRITTGNSIVIPLLMAAALLFLLDVAMRRLELERVLANRIGAGIRRKRKDGTEMSDDTMNPQNESRGATAAAHDPQKTSRESGTAALNPEKNGTGMTSPAMKSWKDGTEMSGAAMNPQKESHGATAAAHDPQKTSQETREKRLDTSLLLKKKRDRNG